jgi:Peptidase family M49
MYQLSPFVLGFPSAASQCAYHPGPNSITGEEVAFVSQALVERKILRENTRIYKVMGSGKPRYEVLQDSIESNTFPQEFPLHDTAAIVVIEEGDNAEDLKNLGSCLSNAAEDAKDDLQHRMISQYAKSFQPGGFEVYRISQQTWIADNSPRVENIFKFVKS